jgi:hypothetical protein
MRLRIAVRLAFVWSSFVAVACVGDVRPPGASQGADRDTDAPSHPGSSGSTSSPPTTMNPTPPPPSACASKSVGRAPLRRLTRREYANTVRALLGQELPASPRLGEDEHSAGFAANATTPIDLTQLETYVELAQALADRAVADGGRVRATLTCDWAQTACVRPFLERFARQAFRRPVDPARVARYTALYQRARSEHAPTPAVAMALATILASPDFVYLGEPTLPGAGV